MNYYYNVNDYVRNDLENDALMIVCVFILMIGFLMFLCFSSDVHWTEFHGNELQGNELHNGNERSENERSENEYQRFYRRRTK